MSGYVCQYCNKVSGTVRESKTGKEKPALSTKGCRMSQYGNHKWIKK